MRFTPALLKGCFAIELEMITDTRGWFARYYSKNEFGEIGFNKDWVQMNHSFNKVRGTLRGLHYQQKPFVENKLVRCIAGAIYDVIVDLRLKSPTFLQWYSIELSASNKKMLFIPEGFAHGFQCLTDNCEILYHHSEVYSPSSENGLRYNDPRLDIQWPMPVSVISAKDVSYALLDRNFIGV